MMNELVISTISQQKIIHLGAKFLNNKLGINVSVVFKYELAFVGGIKLLQYMIKI